MLAALIVEALALTLALEAVVLSFAKVWNRKLVWIFVLVNGFTNVSLNWVVQMVPSMDWKWILVGEFLVVLIEGLAYRMAPMKIRKAIRLSFVANLVSATLGTLILFLLQ